VKLRLEFCWHNRPKVRVLDFPDERAVKQWLDEFRPALDRWVLLETVYDSLGYKHVLIIAYSIPPKPEAWA
jgi:hypothetical protein